MPNYADAKIYTIRCRSNDTLIYIGSTTQKLTQRLAKHRSDCKMGICVSLYKYIVNGDWGDWYIELYEAYPCNSKEELEKREGEVIREIGTINNRIAGRTKKEYYKMNADIIKENKKEYYNNNVEKIKENKKEYYKNNAEKIKEDKKKYQKNNVEKLKEKSKNYRENNVEKLKEKVCCDICGAFIRKYGLTTHQKTQKCTDIASKSKN
jgi:N12 class adenine-specific DNA methylase